MGTTGNTTLSAPISFVGSARRLSVWPKRQTTTGMQVTAWTIASFLIALAWVGVLLWYVIAFGAFFWVTIPFRLLRRMRRRTLRDRGTQQVTMEQMVALQAETLRMQQWQAQQAIQNGQASPVTDAERLPPAAV